MIIACNNFHAVLIEMVKHRHRHCALYYALVIRICTCRCVCVRVHCKVFVCCVYCLRDSVAYRLCFVDGQIINCAIPHMNAVLAARISANALFAWLQTAAFAHAFRRIMHHNNKRMYAIRHMNEINVRCVYFLNHSMQWALGRRRRTAKPGRTQNKTKKKKFILCCHKSIIIAISMLHICIFGAIPQCFLWNEIERESHTHNIR